MPYIIIGRDASDEHAIERRLRVRSKHIDYCAPFFSCGKILYACALLENEKMIGSVMIFDFATRQEVDDYLTHEPYVINQVWANIEIKEALIPDALFKK
ncbi:MAG: YciI family protein [Gammaproteobacteria bacterium]|nr:YciI family protein [Gammaproteobacteria bacterium]